MVDKRETISYNIGMLDKLTQAKNKYMEVLKKC